MAKYLVTVQFEVKSAKWSAEQLFDNYIPAIENTDTGELVRLPYTLKTLEVEDLEYENVNILEL